MKESIDGWMDKSPHIWIFKQVPFCLTNCNFNHIRENIALSAYGLYSNEGNLLLPTIVIIILIPVCLVDGRMDGWSLEMDVLVWFYSAPTQFRRSDAEQEI